MKKIVITAFAALFVFLSSSYAENPESSKNTDLLIRYKQAPQLRDYDWFDWGNFGEIVYYPLTTFNYVYSKGYPIGFNVGGLRLGFKNEEVRYDISDIEYRIPTWSIHNMWIIGTSVTGPFGVSVGLDYGFNKALQCFNYVDTNGSSIFLAQTKTYFSIAPIAGLNVWWFNAFVGYEFVFGFKEIQGLIWGCGISIPFERD